MYKHSASSAQFVKYGPVKFYNIGPWTLSSLEGDDIASGNFVSTGSIKERNWSFRLSLRPPSKKTSTKRTEPELV
jgi:hypothetical protein